MKTIDMLGKPCPIPVIEAKKALNQQGISGVVLLVDNIVAVQNLEKMAKGMVFEFSYTAESKEHYTVTITHSGIKRETESAKTAEAHERTNDTSRGATVLVSDEKMGTGSEELGKILIKGFIYSLCELETTPENVVFLNAGVKLTVSGSNTLEDLKALEAKGAKIKVCGTCLNFYELTDQLGVGEIVNMFDITTALDGAARTITL